VRTTASHALEVHSLDPLCAGPRPDDLIADYVTPIDLHYVRNHAPVPNVDAATYRLEVVGLVDNALALSLEQLVGSFERHEVITTLQCAGNRRSELASVRPFEREVMWDGDAIGTALWAGARLADVLGVAGVASSTSHVWFDGLDRVLVDGATTAFGASIPLGRGRDSDVLLAYEMNGEALPREHGAPMRVVIPGQIGARSVKWLGRITVSDRPSDNHFQRVSYRVPSPGDGATWLPIESSQLNSFIGTPRDGGHVAAGAVRIAGYAVPSGLNSIVDVEVAIDDAGWTPANPLDLARPGTWARWDMAVDLDAGEHQIRVRARDSSGAQQTAGLLEAWNPKGYANGAIQTITVHAQAV
jgi:sulfite oxidase